MLTISFIIVYNSFSIPRSALSLELWLAEEFVLLLGLTTQEFFKGWGKLCAVSGSPPVWQFYGSNWPWPGLLPSAHPYCSLFITKIILQLYSKGQSKHTYLIWREIQSDTGRSIFLMLFFRFFLLLFLLYCANLSRGTVACSRALFP